MDLNYYEAARGKQYGPGQEGGNAWLGSIAVGMIGRIKTSQEFIKEIYFSLI
ncbi:MAG: hypothetical protein HY730_08915 [Candidatus Tectomicrobia bacterium]|uniref:Uncharacterized protein n=1 Tax=Tectimicrobiota bacterium TaxID=2528274 RepID=A0A933GPW3_UNCTE|nr:hypothetical protein [Candidatus Tectomicrobia bacterium]